eukprot:Lankesteria_metandrocarpae@DN8605_c0_g1_i1.p1
MRKTVQLTHLVGVHSKSTPSLTFDSLFWAPGGHEVAWAGGSQLVTLNAKTLLDGRTAADGYPSNSWMQNLLLALDSPTTPAVPCDTAQQQRQRVQQENTAVVGERKCRESSSCDTTLGVGVVITDDAKRRKSTATMTFKTEILTGADYDDVQSPRRTTRKRRNCGSSLDTTASTGMPTEPYAYNTEQRSGRGRRSEAQSAHSTASPHIPTITTRRCTSGVHTNVQSGTDPEADQISGIQSSFDSSNACTPKRTAPTPCPGTAAQSPISSTGTGDGTGKVRQGGLKSQAKRRAIARKAHPQGARKSSTECTDPGNSDDSFRLGSDVNSDDDGGSSGDAMTPDNTGSSEDHHGQY